MVTRSTQGLLTLGKRHVCDSVGIFIKNAKVTLLDAHHLKPGVVPLSLHLFYQGLLTLREQRVCDSVDVFINNAEDSLLEAHHLKLPGMYRLFCICSTRAC